MLNILKRNGVTTVSGGVRNISSGDEVLCSVDAETLVGADLHGADLRWANLVGADLSAADLSTARFEGADLSNAELTHANLNRATLTACKLRGANLRDACLTDSALVGAWLEGADLTGSNLEGAVIKYCHYDSDTKWPTGLDPVARGVGSSAARLRYVQKVHESRLASQAEPEAGRNE